MDGKDEVLTSCIGGAETWGVVIQIIVIWYQDNGHVKDERRLPRARILCGTF